MKFLRLFSSGATGASGAAQCLTSEMPPHSNFNSGATGAELGQETESRPTRPTAQNGAFEKWGSVTTDNSLLNSLLPHSPHSPQLKTPEKIFNVSLATLEYASTQLVACPQSGAKVHLWACSRCPHSVTCKAMAGREEVLKDWLRYDPPLSLALTEGLLEVEPGNPLYPMVAACPDFYKGCFTCRYCNFSKPAFCGKYTRAERMLS